MADWFSDNRKLLAVVLLSMMPGCPFSCHAGKVRKQNMTSLWFELIFAMVVSPGQKRGCESLERNFGLEATETWHGLRQEAVLVLLNISLNMLLGILFHNYYVLTKNMGAAASWLQACFCIWVIWQLTKIRDESSYTIGRGKEFNVVS